MLIESLTTGGVVVLAISAMEVAKLALAKRNGKPSAQSEFVRLATLNGAKIDGHTESVKEMLTELRAHTVVLTEIKTVLKTRGSNA